MKTAYEKLVDDIKNTKVQGYKLTHGTFNEANLVLAEKIPELKRIESAIVNRDVIDYLTAFEIIQDIEEQSCHLKKTDEFVKLKQHIL